MSPIVRAFAGLLVSLAAGLVLFGCSPAGKSVVWQDPKASLAVDQVFVVMPVFNATGKPIEDDRLALLTALLKEQMRTNQLQVANSPPAGHEGLTVRSELLAYDVSDAAFGTNLFGTHSGGTYRCTVRTLLVEQKTGRVVARIVGTREMDVLFYSSRVDWRLLQAMAEEIAGKIASLVQSGGLSIRGSPSGPAQRNSMTSFRIRYDRHRGPGTVYCKARKPKAWGDRLSVVWPSCPGQARASPSWYSWRSA